MNSPTPQPSNTPSLQHSILAVIPARWGSTRFPGKSLAPIAGKPLIQWVTERVKLAGTLSGVLVATDDERIAKAVEPLGVEAVMTNPDHPSGTDRIAEAIQGREADILVNVQGDEPLIDPSLIDAVGAALAGDDSWDMATAATPIGEDRDVENPSIVKVVFDSEGAALYFSRSVIPYVREKDAGMPQGQPLYWRHIGIYGYRRSFLERLVREPPCQLEKAEKLEQLRALYLGCRMKVIPTEDTGIGVDKPEDVERAERVLREAGMVK